MKLFVFFALFSSLVLVHCKPITLPFRIRIPPTTRYTFDIETHCRHFLDVGKPKFYYHCMADAVESTKGMYLNLVQTIELNGKKYRFPIDRADESHHNIYDVVLGELLDGDEL